MKRIIEFLEDERHNLSMTRLVTLALIGFYIMWGSYITWKTEVIPDIPIQVVGLLIALYGVNRGDIIVGAFKGKEAVDDTKKI